MPNPCILLKPSRRSVILPLFVLVSLAACERKGSVVLSNTATEQLAAARPTTEEAKFSKIDDVSINEDDTKTISFEAPQKNKSLECSGAYFSYTSSNTALVAATGGIVFTGTWPNCTTTLTPVANAFGTATITLTFVNEQQTVTTDFALTVTPVNDAPIISAISNRTINEDNSTGVLNFTIADVDNTVLCSSVTATSSNTTIVPDGNIAVAGGATQSCTVTATPAANQNGGPVTITLSLNDGTETTTQTFTVSVTQVDDAPVAAAITPPAFDQDTPSIITLSYTDIENDKATSCALSNLSHVTVSTPCACNGTTGVCTVGVTGTSGYSGAAGFSYTVTANGTQSNSAPATFMINSTLMPLSIDTPTPGNPATQFTAGVQNTQVGELIEILSTSSSDCTTGYVLGVNVSTSTSATVTAVLNFGAGAYTLRARGYDTSGNMRCSTNSVTYTVTPFALDVGTQTVATTGQTNNSHSCAVRSGAVYCWGSSFYGQVGDGTTVSRNVPTAALLTTGVTSLAVGSNSSCAIQNGGLYCWGYNYQGQLGDGTNNNYRTSPVAAVGLSTGVTAVAMGGNATCAIQDGAAKCWGSFYGSSSVTPVQMSGLTSGVTSIALNKGNGEDDTICAVQDGALKCWGRSVGFLGTSDTVSQATPVLVTSLSTGVTAVSVGPYRVCAIQNGGLFCWGGAGSPTATYLGNGTTGPSYTPVPVTGLSTGVTSVSVSNSSSSSGGACAIKDGGLYCWGAQSSYPMAGDGTSINAVAPVPVVGLSTGVSSVSVGYYSTCVVHNAQPRCWGDNTQAQLGEGGLALYFSRPRPTHSVLNGVGAGIFKLRGDGGGAGFCTLQNGVVKCWGSNASGALGDGTTASVRSTPASPTGLTSDVTDLAFSSTYLTASGGCAVQSGALKCWGKNNYGQLGDNTTNDALLPQLVQNMSSNVTGVYRGQRGDSTCAVQNGQLYCWGRNTTGQLGIGTTSTTSTLVPTAVTGLTNVSGLNIAEHSNGGAGSTVCAIQDGSLYCWGANPSAQVGNGGATNQSTPYQVTIAGSTTGVSAVATTVSGGNSGGITGTTCAIKDGGVYCWGLNTGGQAGVGTTTNVTTPTAATGLTTNVTALVAGYAAGTVTAGSTSFCAIQNGALYCWGQNNFGQIGDGGATTYRNIPTLVTGLSTGVTKVAVNRLTVCAIKDFALYCWGDNGTGGVGDGTTQKRTAPVKILDTGVTDTFGACAVVNKQLKCWGRSSLGQTGADPDYGAIKYYVMDPPVP